MAGDGFGHGAAAGIADTDKDDADPIGRWIHGEDREGR
jgi:hypothetical protein